VFCLIISLRFFSVELKGETSKSYSALYLISQAESKSKENLLRLTFNISHNSNKTFKSRLPEGQLIPISGNKSLVIIISLCRYKSKIFGSQEEDSVQFPVRFTPYELL
jgi:hypothetical protein